MSNKLQRFFNPLMLQLCVSYLQTLLILILTIILLFTFATSLGDLVEGRLPFEIVIFKTLYKIPTIINKALGLICMIAAFLTLAQKSQSLELMAIESLGIPHTRYFWLIGGLTLVLSTSWFYFSFEYLTPKSEVRLAQIGGAQVDEHLRDVAEGNFWTRQNDLYIQFKKLDRSQKQIFDLMIYRFSNNTLLEMISSPQAQVLPQQLQLLEVTVRHSIHHPTAPGSVEKLPNWTVPVSPELIKKVFKPQADPEKLPLSEKIEQLRLQIKLGTPHHSLENNLYKNLGLYLSCMALLLIAFSFTQLNSRRANNITQGASCLAIAILYWIIYNTMVSFSEVGMIAPMYGQTLPLAGSILFSWYKNHQNILNS